MERLPDASRDGTLQSLKSVNGDSMAVDIEEPSTMEVDDENERPKKRSRLANRPWPIVFIYLFVHCHLMIHRNNCGLIIFYFYAAVNQMGVRQQIVTM